MASTRSRVRSISSLAALGVLGACSGVPTPIDGAPEGGVDAAPADSGLGPEWTPDIPWLADGAPAIAEAVLGPCPEGWRELTSGAGSAVTCEPYPEGGPETCPIGEAHFLGGAACAPVGSPCPAGDWPEGLPSAGVVYVQSGAPAGGDGTTRSSPFATVVAALDAAPEGATIALAKGRYEEVVQPARSLTIVGACATETVIAPRILNVLRAAVAIVGVETVTMRDLSVVDAPGLGIIVAGAATALELEGVVINNAVGLGIFVRTGARVSAHELVVSATRPEPDGRFGRGLNMEPSASVQLSRALFIGNHDVGLFVNGVGATLELELVAVRDTASGDGAGTGGRGLTLLRGARADASRSLFEGNRDVAISAADGATLRLDQVVVRDTGSREGDGTGGRGLNLQDADAEVSRSLFEGNRDAGIYASGGSTLALTDVVVRDTSSRPSDGTGGRGLALQNGSSASVIRARFERNREVGVFVGGPFTSLRLEDVTVLDTLGREADAELGRGLNVQGSARAEVVRSRFERNHEVGIYVSDPGTELSVADAVVRDTQSRESDGAMGRGVEVNGGARVELARTLLERNRELAVYAGGAATVLSVTESVVRDTRFAACVAAGSCTRPAISIGAYGLASVTVSGFVIDGSDLCGVQVSDPDIGAGSLDLSTGVVRRTDIGACLQVEDYDVGRLLDGVTYIDNRINSQATSLPTPDTASPVDG